MLELLEKYEPLWLLIILLAGLLVELHSNYVLRLEYKYDKDKDDAKKQKRTKTTKRTTTQPSGASVVEESVETSEPVQEEKK